MTATVVLTRWRDEPQRNPIGREIGPDGAGFEYFRATWRHLVDRSELPRADPSTADPAVLLDLTGVAKDDAIDQLAALREIVGDSTCIETYRGPVDSLGGNKAPYFRALELGLSSADGEILLLEDDLDFCGNGYARMKAFPLPSDLHWVSFFGPQILTRAKAWAGLWRVPAPARTQANKYRRATVEKLLDWRDGAQAWAMFRACDQALDRARAELGLRWGLHVPELVQHVGLNSTQGDGPSDDRRAHSFPGPAFDAMSLFSAHHLYL